MTLTFDVRARIGDFRLDARASLPPGLTVLFGPSGAGKTRLLRLVAGLDRPETGRITLDRRVFTDVGKRVHLPPQDRDIGMIFQQDYLMPHLNALENVVVAVREGNRRQRRARAAELLERVDADALATRRPSQLSGGQRQRIALARALAGRPRLLLLDEPFNALDQDVRVQLRSLVREVVTSSGLPALFVTHDRDELHSLADRVLIAEHGRIERLVEPREVLNSDRG